MKKLILLIAIALIAVSTGLSLEPTRVSVYAPQFRTVAEGGSGPATSVRVDLVDYNGGATTLYTGKVFSAPDAEVTADDNGVILVTVGGSTDVHPTLGPSTFADVWGDIDAGNMNTFWTFDIYINGTLYSQGRIDQQVIIQANTSIFNSSGVLLPSGNPSTVGDDNNRFDAVYVKENEADLDLEGVYIGPSGGVGTNQLSLTYDNTAGEGIITSNGAAIMNFDATGVDLNGTIVDNVAEINAGNQALAISGAFTANQALNTIGDNTDGLQLTIDGVPSTQPVPAGEFELEIDGDAKMEYLEVSGFSLTGDFNMNDNTIYNVEEVVGRSSDGQLLLNATPSASPVWTANGPITTGTGLFTINGNLDADAGVDVFGASLTVNDGSAATPGTDVFVVNNTNGNTDIAGTLTVDGNSTIGDANTDEVFFNAEVSSNFVPFDGNRDLGLNTNHRWRSAYLNDVLHIGEDNGEGSAELAVNYSSDVANFNVDGATGPQFAIDATTGIEQILLDPVGDGVNYTITEGYININNSANADLHISETQIMRTDASDQTLTFRNDNVGAVLNIDIEGKLDVQSAASTMGDGADATQLTVEGLVAGASNALVVEGSTDIDARLNVDGNTTLNEDVTLGDADTDEINVLGEFVSNLVPQNASAPLSLGTDANRWADIYVLGNSVHVGDANGEGSAELNIGYSSNVATLNVDGAGNNQVAIDAANSLIFLNAEDDANSELMIDPTNDAINLDPNSDATVNYTFASTGATVNTGANTDLVITEGTIERNNAATETLFIQNTTGTDVLDVDIDGKINVQSAASTIGDNTDNTQLTIDGADGTNDVLVVEGNASITDNLDVEDGVDVTGSDLTVGGTNFSVTVGTGRITTNEDLLFTNAVSKIFNNAGEVQVNDIFEVTNTNTTNTVFSVNNANGNTDVSGTLNADGNTTLNGNVDLGDAADDDINAAGEFISNLTPNTDNAYDLGSFTLTQRWRNLWLANNANVGNILQVDGATVLGSDDADNIRTNGEFVTSLVPNTTNNVDLGTAAKEWRDIHLANNAEIGNDANVGNDLDVVGATTLNGTVALGDADTDDITVTGEFVSDLIPNTTAANLDLGSSAKQWRDINLSRNAEVGNNVNAGNNVNVGNNLRLLEDPGNGTNVVGFTAPANLASNTIWTLPDDDGSANQQLITDGSGNLSWGDASLQTAYEGGNTITTANADGNVEIFGTEDLDVRIDIVNGNTGIVRVDDDLVVTGGLQVAGDRFNINSVSGNLRVGTGLGVLTVDGNTGATVVSGNLDANSGLDVTGANFTVNNGGADRFRVQQSGNTLIEGTLTVNDAADMTAGLDVTGANFTVGGANFTVNQSNGNTDIQGVLSQHHTTAIGNSANVYILSGTNAQAVLSNIPTPAAGTVIQIVFSEQDGSGDVDTGGNVDATNINGATVLWDGSEWYIVATF